MSIAGCFHLNNPCVKITKMYILQFCQFWQFLKNLLMKILNFSLFKNTFNLDMRADRNSYFQDQFVFLPSRVPIRPFLPVAQSYLIPFHIIINLAFGENRIKSSLKNTFQHFLGWQHYDQHLQNTQSYKLNQNGGKTLPPVERLPGQHQKCIWKPERGQ